MVMFPMINDVTLSLKYDVYKFKMLTSAKGPFVITGKKNNYPIIQLIRQLVF